MFCFVFLNLKWQNVKSPFMLPSFVVASNILRLSAIFEPLPQTHSRLSVPLPAMWCSSCACPQNGLRSYHLRDTFSNYSDKLSICAVQEPEHFYITGDLRFDHLITAHIFTCTYKNISNISQKYSHEQEYSHSMAYLHTNY